MERRDRSLKAYEELIYINSLDDTLRAQQLVAWVESYLNENKIEDFDLDTSRLKKLAELFFSNIKFLKEHKENTRQEILKVQKMKKFLKH